MRIQKEMDYEASRIDWNITSSFRHGQPFRRSLAARTERTLRGRYPFLTQQRKTIRSVHHQTRHEPVVWLTEADPCGGSEYWIRRRWPCRWYCGYSSARLALRHSQLCRCCPLLTSKDYRVIVPYLTRVWHDAFSFE